MNVAAADLARYVRGERPATLKWWLRMPFTQFGLHAVLTYRLGRAVQRTARNPIFLPLVVPGWLAYVVCAAWVRLAYDIRISLRADIGPGLYVGHHGAIRIHACKLGAGCALGEVTEIGLPDDPRGPVVGRDVWIGSHTRILPSARVGDAATIGAGSIVDGEVAARTLVSGKPLRAIARDYDNGHLK